MKYYLAAFAVFRGENFWLEEWIRYHLAIGVEHFYLYNNDVDTRESDAILEPYVAAGLVDNIRFPDEKSQQTAIRHVLTSRKNECFWMAILDLDEFLLPKHTDSLPDYLADFEEFAGLAIHWNIFGSSGLVDNPPNQIGHFLHRAEESHPVNRHVKSVVRPDLVLPGGFWNPHHFPSKTHRVVDENRNPVEHAICDYTAQTIRVIHYIVRSRRWFFDVKATRGLSDDVGPRDETYWRRHDRNEVFDDEISRRFGHLAERKRT